MYTTTFHLFQPINSVLQLQFQTSTYLSPADISKTLFMEMLDIFMVPVVLPHNAHTCVNYTRVRVTKILDDPCNHNWTHSHCTSNYYHHHYNYGKITTTFKAVASSRSILSTQWLEFSRSYSWWYKNFLTHSSCWCSINYHIFWAIFSLYKNNCYNSIVLVWLKQIAVDTEHDKEN